jgi:hypothetical protein
MLKLRPRSYAWRTSLRRHLPWFLIDLGIASKGKDCEAVGAQHHWYNIDHEASGCYHCEVVRPGQLWRRPGIGSQAAPTAVATMSRNEREPSRSTAFQLQLLERIQPACEASVLQQLGLTEGDASEIRKHSTFRLLDDLTNGIDAFTAVLGAPFKSVAGEFPEPFTGSVTHYFVLELWPHLYWVVNTQSDADHSYSWDVGFRNQIEPRVPGFDPSLVRPGVWTRSLIEPHADGATLTDGWDEQRTMEYTFGSRRFEGEFVFDLLQKWRKL